MDHLYSCAYGRAFMIRTTIEACIFLFSHGYWPFSLLASFDYSLSIFDTYAESRFFNLRTDEQE